MNIFYKDLFGASIELYGDVEAIECDGISYTYRQLNEAVEDHSRRLSELGIKSGDKVILLHRHPFTFSLLLLSCFYLGAVPMPVYSKTGNAKVERMIEGYEVNYIIKGEKYLEYSVDNLGYAQDPELEDTKIVLFTSGTTSMPKAIMLSGNNVCSNVFAISEYLQLKQKDRILLIKDLSHSSSIIGELLVGLSNGCKVVMTTKLALTSMVLQLLDKQQISVFFAVPTILKGIISSTKLHNYDLSNLRIINFYGASMNYKDIESLITLFPNANVIYSYGQTEASPRVTYIMKNDLLRKKGSSGRPIKDVSIKICDDDGNEVPAYSCGEIVVNGPNVMRGYYKNKQKTNFVKRNGELHTGDLGYLDDEGFLYVKGRKDNMIISSGKNIYPEEIEGVLMTYDSILEALVVADSKENSTCNLMAYVVLKTGDDLDHTDLYEHCKNQLEFYKIPQKITVVEKLEKTPSGKIKRSIGS